MSSTMGFPFFTALICAVSFALPGCRLLIAETSTEVVDRLEETVPETIPEPSVKPIESEAIAALDSTLPTVTITRYKVDDQCNSFIPEDLTVPEANSLQETVAKIIGDRSNGDFRIAGYRLQLDKNTDTLTLDFRLPIDSPRSIHSLSHCEQFALLGELRETLIANNEWNIETVNFQVQGQIFQYQ